MRTFNKQTLPNNKYTRPPMLGWSDFMTLPIDETPERHKLANWLTYNPCAVIQDVNKGGGQYLRSNVYFRFSQKAQGCEN